MTVAELRKQGYKVRVLHYRWYSNDMEEYPEYELLTRREMEEANYLYNVFNPNPDIFGGKTVVEITTPEQRNLIGVAECSLKDNFNRKLGLTKALGRAMSQLSK